jgi:type I restriction enzyme S subunit
MSNRKVPKGSILLSFKRTIGKLAIAGCDMYCNEAIAYLNSKNTKIPQMFLYYILDSLNLEIYGRGTIGSNGNLNKEILKDIQIPIPKSEQKIQEWVDKISKPYDEKNTKINKIKELEEYVKNKIKDIGENEDCDEVELGSLCEIKSGKPINSENRKGTLYPYYAANGISGYLDEYIFDGKYILCAQDGSIGATYLVNCKFYPSNHVWVIKSLNINSYYIYCILKNNIDYKNITSGSVIPKLTKEKLIKIKIKIPKNKQLIQDLEPTFDEIEKLQGEVKEAETLYNQLIKELSEEAMPVPATNTSATNTSATSTNTTNTANIQELTNTGSDSIENNIPSSQSSTSSTSSIKSLHEQCKSLGIKGYSKYRNVEDKDKLLKLIAEHK